MFAAEAEVNSGLFESLVAGPGAPVLFVKQQQLRLFIDEIGDQIVFFLNRLPWETVHNDIS